MPQRPSLAVNSKTGQYLPLRAQSSSSRAHTNRDDDAPRRDAAWDAGRASPGLGQRLPGERLRLRDGRLRANLLRRGRPLPGRAARAVRRPIRQTEGSGGLHWRCGRGRHLRSPRVGGQLQATSYRQRRPKVQTDGLITNVRLLHLRWRSVLPLLGQLYPPLQHLRPLNRPLQRQPLLETDRMLVLGRAEPGRWPLPVPLRTAGGGATRARSSPVFMCCASHTRNVDVHNSVYHTETYVFRTVPCESVNRLEQQLLSTAPQAPLDRSR